MAEESSLENYEAVSSRAGVQIPPTPPYSPLAQWLVRTAYNCVIQVQFLNGLPKKIHKDLQQIY